MEYIYALTENGKAFYIGKTKNPDQRKKRHIYDAVRLGMRLPVHIKIRKALKSNHFDMKVIECVVNAKGREKYWIDHHSHQGDKLYNINGKKNHKYRLIDRNGEYHYTDVLSEFCAAHNLPVTALCKVLIGKMKHYKGWRIERSSV